MSNLETLGTLMKTLSMRRENLYRALDTMDVASNNWHNNDREINAINESMNSIEDERSEIRAKMRRGPQGS